MRLILSNLNHPNRYVRSSAIEALEVRVDPPVLGGILPLFEHENIRVIAEHGGSQFELPTRSPREVLAELTRHRSPWVRACAIYVVGRAGDTEDLKPLEERLDDRYELAQLKRHRSHRPARQPRKPEATRNVESRERGDRQILRGCRDRRNPRPTLGS